MCASLTIRPFATTSKYDSPTLDLQEAGQAMHVTDVVTGHFLKEGSQLQITLEAIDVDNNRTLWRDTMTVAAPDMIAMRGEITAKVRQGLVPALGAGSEFGGGRDASQERRGLRSIPAQHLRCRTILLPNKDAIAMLERAVGLDPTYAPGVGRSRSSLPLRFGLLEWRGRSLSARYHCVSRALALDPDYIDPAGELIRSEVERGESSRPIKARKPWWRGIRRTRMPTLRCLTFCAMAAPSKNPATNAIPRCLSIRETIASVPARSTFDQLGNYARAMQFLQLDAGTEWSSGNMHRDIYSRPVKWEKRGSLRKTFATSHGLS